MTFTDLVNFFVGKKTFIIAVVAILYGFFYKDQNAIWIGLSAMGLKIGQNEATKQIIAGQ